jgi:hypothetical protein
MGIVIVIVTWMLVASAEYYDYVKESGNVALGDVIFDILVYSFPCLQTTPETGFLNDCSCASDWTLGFYLVPTHVLVHVPVLYFFPSPSLFLCLSCDSSFFPFRFRCSAISFATVNLHFAWVLCGLGYDGEEEVIEAEGKCSQVSSALFLLPPKYYGNVLEQGLMMAFVLAVY